MEINVCRILSYSADYILISNPFCSVLWLMLQFLLHGSVHILDLLNITGFFVGDAFPKYCQLREKPFPSTSTGTVKSVCPRASPSRLVLTCTTSFFVINLSLKGDVSCWYYDSPSIFKSRRLVNGKSQQTAQSRISFFLIFLVPGCQIFPIHTV